VRCISLLPVPFLLPAVDALLHCAKNCYEVCADESCVVVWVQLGAFPGQAARSLWTALDKRRVHADCCVMIRVEDCWRVLKLRPTGVA